MRKEERLARGENNFQKYIIPAVQSEFPGHWHSCNGSEADMKHGIDYFYTEGQSTKSIAARVWMGIPRQHFAVRWKKESDLDRPLEVDSRLDALACGGPMSNITMEGFVYKRRVWVAWIDSLVLWKAIGEHLDELNHFPIMNEADKTWFKQVPFELLEGHIQKKFISPLP